MITKIKFTGAGLAATQITIKDEENETNKKTILTSTELRNADFTIAMRALEPVVREMLPLQDTLEKDDIEVTGVSLTFNESQGLGAVITLKLTAEAFNTPLIINTPHIHEDKDDTGVKAMPWEMAEALNELIHQAELFVAGMRAQESLQFEDAVAREKEQPRPAREAGREDVRELVADVAEGRGLTEDDIEKVTDALMETHKEFHENIAKSGMRVTGVEGNTVHISCDETEGEPA